MIWGLENNVFPVNYFVADKSSGDNDLKPSATKDLSCYILKHYQNISSPDLKKTVATTSSI